MAALSQSGDHLLSYNLQMISLALFALLAFLALLALLALLARFIADREFAAEFILLDKTNDCYNEFLHFNNHRIL